MIKKDENRVLSGEFDTDQGGRRAANRMGLREDLRTLVAASHWTDEEWVLLTEQDCILILQASARLQTQAAKWVETRSRQGRQWGATRRRPKAVKPTVSESAPVSNDSAEVNVPAQPPLNVGTYFWGQVMTMKGGADK